MRRRRPSASIAATASASGRPCSGTVRVERTAKASSPASPRRAERDRASGASRSRRSSSTGAEPLEQRRRRVLRDDPPGVHEGHAVADGAGLVEVVGRHQDRRAAAAQAGDQVEQLAADARVEPDGRLVEEQHLRAGTRARGRARAAAAPRPSRRRAGGRSAGERERVDDLVHPRGAPPGAARPTAGRAAPGAGGRSGRGRPPRPGTRRCSRGGLRAARGPRREPATRALPAVGRMVVVSMPMVVDLPAPFGPSRPNASPGSTCRSMPRTASTPPG